ncbi:hypothetical protein [Arcobacter sp. YIC-310]|uniref:hypothetical protein n=1 Tax=Arcobacter sp. YIC-310 TaxID=3376632 RepID=UPI003C203796
MRNLLKLSLITSMLLTSNLFALTDAEQDIRIEQNTDDINEDLKPRMDSVERLASDAFATATNARIKADNNTSDITTLKTRMTNVEDNYVKQDMFFNEMTYVFNDINQNKDDISIEKDRNDNQQIQIDNNTSKNTSQDISINQNISDISIERDRNNVQDTQISDNRNSININTSNISSNRSLAQDNHSRLNQKDVVDNRQDADIAELKKDVEEIKNQGLENFLSKVDEEMDKKASVLGALNANHDFTNGDTSVSLNTTSFNGKEAFGASIAVRKENLIFSLSGATDFKGNKALQGKVQMSF